jgi:hypothetical protein
VGEGYAMILHPGFLMEGIFGIFLFLVMLAYSVYLYVDRKPAVTLSAYGVTARSWRGRQIVWDNISYVEVHHVRRQYSVLVHLETGNAYGRPGNKTYKIPTNMIKIPPYELCELMQVISAVPPDSRNEAFDGILSGVNLTVIRSKFISAKQFH